MPATIRKIDFSEWPEPPKEPSGALYPHPETGMPILTNSMLGAFRRCIKQAEYKYVHRLKPKRLGSPLKRGTWVHSLLEEDAKGKDWHKLHTKLSHQFENLSDGDRDFYGDMPSEIETIMNSYFWHYKADPWTYHETELELTAELDGVLIRIKFDALIENQFGLYLVDHKTHKTLPKLDYRLLDTQSPLYTWVAHQNKIPVQGFIWNYVRWKAPVVPKLAYRGTARQRLSLRDVETDYPTFIHTIKQFQRENGFKVTPEVKAKADYLKAQRYVPGALQTSPFFLRSVIEKSPETIRQVLLEARRTAERMNTYDWSEGVERTVGRHCEFMCSYRDLCTTELTGGNTRPLIKQNYEVGDPMSYYSDKAGEDPNKEM